MAGGDSSAKTVGGGKKTKIYDPWTNQETGIKQQLN